MPWVFCTCLNYLLKKLQQVSNPHLTLQDIEKDLGSIHFGESLTHEVEKSVMVWGYHSVYGISVMPTQTALFYTDGIKEIKKEFW